MDKFGIFNLLNSFLCANDAKKENENGFSPADAAHSFSAENSANNRRPEENKELEKPRRNGQNPEGFARSTPEKHEFLPLQAGMLSVMRSHDEFVKRVREKYAKKPE